MHRLSETRLRRGWITQIRLTTELGLQVRAKSVRAMRSEAPQCAMKRALSLRPLRQKRRQLVVHPQRQREVKRLLALKLPQEVSQLREVSQRQQEVNQRQQEVNQLREVNRGQKLHRDLRARTTTNQLNDPPESNAQKRLARNRQGPKRRHVPSHRAPSLLGPKLHVLNQRAQNLCAQKPRGQNLLDLKLDQNRRDQVLTRQGLHTNPTTIASFGVRALIVKEEEEAA